ncbi:TetR family transcriptional regulator [Nostocoides sp. F2B08]|uniref:TetR family transcriptional regulator n=1 Tax=Nostocoides sp. F2B08 TaxID=2653936 RepID=UPI001D03E489|nr:TetR family transcriptional regulator [Tetrasphaera sp. F2B08]
MSATTPAAGADEAQVTTVDGRSRRWDEHRAARRQELVDATLRAIRVHGAKVGMDDIAAVAGTSKTVFYRHFTDRSGLYAAVSARVDANIMRDVTSAAGDRSGSHHGGRAVIAAAIDAYLRMVEEEPEIYRFVVTAPLLERGAVGDPSAPVSAHIAEQISALLDATLAAGVSEPVRSRVWAHGVVGMVRAAADDWLTRGGAHSGLDRTELADLLTDLAWSGLSGAWS